MGKDLPKPHSQSATELDSTHMSVSLSGVPSLSTYLLPSGTTWPAKGSRGRQLLSAC